MNQLPSASELARETGLSYKGAYGRLRQFRDGRISIAELFQPAAPPRRPRMFSGHAAQEIMDRVPGLSLSAAEQRFRDYKNGARSFESLFYPKRYHPPSAGSVEWQSLGEQERLENMPVLGFWEKKQLQEGSR